MFDVPQDEGDASSRRSAAKAVNFGVIYGMSSFALSSGINVSRKEAERYIGEYFRRLPDGKEIMDRRSSGMPQKRLSRNDNGAEEEYIPEISASSYMVRQLGERLAMNSPIQGSAADIIRAGDDSCVQETQKRKALIKTYTPGA